MSFRVFGSEWRQWIGPLGVIVAFMLAIIVGLALLGMPGNIEVGQ